ncbi:MAG: carboxylesterase family protein [Deltaproteobacteria bacterium]|jgi:para-nitrobenzyl esterase|nr:carboxylesterase family protein [Deltaproteobacteria bacterium]
MTPAKAIVDTACGPVAGTVSAGTAVFKGIPYAEPPAGRLRWAPPVPRRPWDGPLDCSRFGAPGFQSFRRTYVKDPPGGGFLMSEDCLSLNVWTPAGAPGAVLLPVYVFFHGGGFAAGSSSQPLFGTVGWGRPRPLYDGAALARKGIVAVTVNYRLGAMGFLALEDSFRRHRTAGNWGILDQIEALKWVRANIAAFGGDPGRVTVGGVSAGAVCASLLSVSPLASGLFRACVSESGTALSLPGFPVAKGDLACAFSLGAAFMRLLGLPSGARGLDALERIDPRVLARLSTLDFDFRRLSPMSFSPVADGTVVPDDPHAALAAGEVNCRSFLLGFNRDEGSLFIPRETDRRVLSAVEHCFLGPGGREAFEKVPPPDAARERGRPWHRTRRAVAYALFTAGTRRFADLCSRHSDVRLYRFDHAPPLVRLAGLGACHALELPFVFGSLKLPGLLSGMGSAGLSRLMCSQWAGFVATGTPGRLEAGDMPGAAEAPAPEGFSWPAYAEGGGPCAVFSASSGAAPLPDAGGLGAMADAFFGKLPPLAPAPATEDG